MVSSVFGPPVDEIVLRYDDLIDLASNHEQHVVYRAPHADEHLDVMYTRSSTEHDRNVSIPGSIFLFSFTHGQDRAQQMTFSRAWQR